MSGRLLCEAQSSAPISCCPLRSSTLYSSESRFANSGCIPWKWQTASNFPKPTLFQATTDIGTLMAFQIDSCVESKPHSQKSQFTLNIKGHLCLIRVGLVGRVEESSLILNLPDQLHCVPNCNEVYSMCGKQNVINVKQSIAYNSSWFTNQHPSMFLRVCWLKNTHFSIWELHFNTADCVVSCLCPTFWRHAQAIQSLSQDP